MKKGIFIAIFFALFISLSLVSAQTPGIDIEKLQNDSVVKNVQKLQELTEEQKWNALGEQWQSALLNNTFIAKTDSTLKKGNIIFKIVLARDYSLSLTLIFAFILWLIFFLKLPRYLIFLNESWMRILASLAFSIGISHTQLFNKLADLIFKLYFFKVEWYWKVLSSLAILVALVIYYAIISYFGSYFEAQKIKKEKIKQEIAAKKVETIANKVSESADWGSTASD